ncbi:NAD(P)-binding protein [Myriangium duriaei CBS 260.36]|uniref:NAD(P)-binding protein n=1 Tax=Myriangium duriaei CBS 260.36 TaxID=1168546 RepID=A0A9P4MN87_9PEZI|nr:NAD(P)-binding protein [Myriangium duriaei CBS 260.36]
MAAHSAIVTVAPRAPLELTKAPTVAPETNEVLVKVEYSSAGPLELHQAEGGLLVTHPQILGDAVVGTVVRLGPDVKDLREGDRVFGFAFALPKQKSWQTYSTVEETMVGKLPDNITPEQAVVIPTNLVTAFHTLVTDLGLQLPWPKPDSYKPAVDKPVLIWGGSSSVGQYSIQVLKYYGYSHIAAVASKRQHDMLRSIGANRVFDYNDSDIVQQLQSLGDVPLIVDCIGSKDDSLAIIAKVAQSGSRVAIMLPVIVRHAADSSGPIYEMEVQNAAPWADGVEPRGVRTHQYADNKFHAEHLQKDVIPDLVSKGIIKPNKIKVVEGKNMLERAQKCIDLLRSKALSGEKLVWKLDDEELTL